MAQVSFDEISKKVRPPEQAIFSFPSKMEDAAVAKHTKRLLAQPQRKFSSTGWNRPAKQPLVLGESDVCFLSWWWQTKPPPN